MEGGRKGVGGRERDEERRGVVVTPTAEHAPQ